MKEEQPADRNQLIKKIKKINRNIISQTLTGNFDKALKFIKQGEDLIKLFHGDLPAEIKRRYTLWLYVKATNSVYRGNLNLSFKEANDLIRVAKLYDNKRGISEGYLVLGTYYWFSGDLDKALMQINLAISLSEENLNTLADYIILTNHLMCATMISIDSEDLGRAKKYFRRLEEIRETYQPIGYINDAYKLAKAYLLKSSMRARDRVIAEDIFREIIEDESSVFIMKLESLSGLCELLLVELKISNDINIIGELKPLIEKLINMAQTNGFYYYLIEAYILHGKLALIMFDIKSARRYLMQARRMAENCGYIGFADEIAGLHEDLMERLDTWEQLEKTNAPLSERMELAQLEDHLKGKFRSRVMKMERISEGMVYVYKGSQPCLVCKGSAEGFNVYVCSTCNSHYCKACAQAVINLGNQCWSCNSPIDTSKKTSEIYECNTSLNILHISDIQEGRFGIKEDISRVDQDYPNYILDLKSKLEILHRKNKIDIIAISGDLASTGEKEEFDNLTKEFIPILDDVFLNGKNTVPKDRWIIVPGNHDVEWDKDKARFNNFVLFCQENGFLPYELNSPESIYSQTVCREKNTGNLLGILGLNSCLEIMDENSRNSSNISNSYYSQFSKGWDDEFREIPKMMVCHHMLHSIKGEKFDHALNNLRDNNVLLTLAGDIHKTEPFADEINKIKCIPAGTISATKTERQVGIDVVSRQFNLVNLNLQSGYVKWYTHIFEGTWRKIKNESFYLDHPSFSKNI